METDTQARNLMPFSLPTPIHLLARSVQPPNPGQLSSLCSSALLHSFIRSHSHNHVLSSHYGPSHVLGAEAAAKDSTDTNLLLIALPRAGGSRLRSPLGTAPPNPVALPAPIAAPLRIVLRPAQWPLRNAHSCAENLSLDSYEKGLEIFALRAPARPPCLACWPLSPPVPAPSWVSSLCFSR